MDEPLKGKYRNAKVFIRVFPSEKINWDLVKIGKDRKSIYCRCLQCYRKKTENVKNYWHFRTDGVFYNCSQMEVYTTVTSGVIKNAFKGHNIIIAAYGQTGSGKSLTTLGLYNSYQDCGIAPRLITDLFLQIKSKENRKITVSMSCLEIKNTHFTDLLDEELKMRDQSAIKLVSSIVVNDVNEALSTLYKAEGRRQFVDNSNYESHKTHFVVTLEVTTKITHIITGKIHIIDLAGADTYRSISCSYKELIDVAIGNLAKTQLEQFLLILCENIPAHIIAKQHLNALIYYLKDSLNSQSVLRFIGHIYTDLQNHMLTISMLRFAHIILCLPPKELVSNSVETEGYKIECLQKRVEQLETERVLQSMILNTDLAREMTQNRIYYLQNLAKDYLHNTTNELGILSVSDVTMFLKVFKDMYNSLKGAKEKLQSEINEINNNIKKSESEVTKSQSKIIKKGNLIRLKDSMMTTKTQDSVLGLAQINKRAIDIKQETQSLPRVQKITSQTSLKTAVKTSTSKSVRKKSSTIEVIKQQSVLLIPDSQPTYEQAQKLFTTNNEYNYNKLNEIKKACAVAVDAANKEYIEQVKKLKKFNELLERRKCEHLQAEMQKQFIGEPIASDIANKCLEKIVEIEVMVMRQQEIVLKHQTDLTIAVENHNRAKKDLADEFDRFCMDKFKTLIPQLVEEPPEAIIEIVEAEKSIIEEQNYQKEHNQLQKVMMMEQKKAVAKRKEQNKRWLV